MTEDAAPQIIKAPIVFGYCCLRFKSFQFTRNPYSYLFPPILIILWLAHVDVEKLKLVLFQNVQLQMVCLGQEWRRYLSLASYPVKGLLQTLSPCASEMMAPGGYISETKVAQTNKKLHLLQTRVCKCLCQICVVCILIYKSNSYFSFVFLFPQCFLYDQHNWSHSRK